MCMRTACSRTFAMPLFSVRRAFHFTALLLISSFLLFIYFQKQAVKEYAHSNRVTDGDNAKSGLTRGSIRKLAPIFQKDFNRRWITVAKDKPFLEPRVRLKTTETHREEVNANHFNADREYEDSQGLVQKPSEERVDEESEEITVNRPKNFYFIEEIKDAVYEKAETAEYLKNFTNTASRFTHGQGVDKSNEVVELFLMPHSHNDPGWLMTFEAYHQSRNTIIFENLVKFISTEGKDFPFQWSESVSLYKWYRDTSEQNRQILREAVAKHQVMIDSGSWVMPDEASTTLYSLVENLILGHTWIKNEFNIKPEYSWSNDPFGHSSTLPYLLKQSGIKAMVINRIDMLVKKELRERQNLEFLWRQHYDITDSSSDILTHILPHELYNTWESLGPNPKDSKKFDFSPVEGSYVPLYNRNSSGHMVANEMLVREYAQELAKQVHNKAAYYRHNILLVPIGDDFRYITYDEFEGVSRNWRILQDFYEKNPEFKVKLKLSTLGDYFRELERRKVEFPVLSGDFFPYSDKSDMLAEYSPKTTPWWTGYFTTRPHFKAAVKKLEILLRQTEILYSYLTLTTSGNQRQLLADVSPLADARENLTWLLHHDAITGTSETFVMTDFETHLNLATERLSRFSSQVMFNLVLKLANSSRSSLDVPAIEDQILPHYPPPLFILDGNGKARFNSIIIGYNDQKSFMLFNQIGHDVKSVVHIPLRVPRNLTRILLHVADDEDYTIPCQLNPYYVTEYDMSEDYMELSFEATVTALSTMSYTVVSKDMRRDDSEYCTYPSIKIYSMTQTDDAVKNARVRPGFITKPENRLYKLITLRTDTISVTISPLNGSLIAVAMGSHSPTPVNLNFGLYNSGEEKSAGADFSHLSKPPENGYYIFTAADEGKEINNNDSVTVIVIDGLVEKVVLARMKHLTHVIRVNHLTPAISITNAVNLTVQGDLFMRVHSNIQNDKSFYTDSNSYVMVKRTRRFPKMPIASDYYPMTSAAYIQDGRKRLTILSAQSLGVTSTGQGRLEVMLDRNHNTFDHGGVHDILTSRPYAAEFVLMIEALDSPKSQAALSSASFHACQLVQYPLAAYSGMTAPVSQGPIAKLPCDYQLINFRTMNLLPLKANDENKHDTFAVVLHRTQIAGEVDHSDEDESDICSHLNTVHMTFPAHFDISKSSLSLLQDGEKISSIPIQLAVNQIQSIRVRMPRT